MAAGTMMWSCMGPEKLKEPGIQLYSLRNELPDDRAGILRAISDIGYKYLETYLMGGKHHLGYDVTEYKSMLDDLGLQVMSGHIPTGRTNPEVEGSLVNNFEKTLEDANYLGQKYIVCPYLADSERTSLDDYKKTIELLNASGEKCKSAGITFAYHNHEFEFIEMDGVVPMEMIIEESDPDLVKIELDIYWSTRGKRDAVEMFNKYPNRFVLWHVKDMNKQRPEETTFVGDGSIDYARVFENRANSGMEYYFVEQEHYPTPALDGIQKSFDYLNALKS